MSKIKSYFITGLLVVVPLYITVYVFTLIVGMMDSVFNILPALLRPHTYLPFNIPGMGLFFTIFGIFVVGVFAQNLAGKRLVGLSEKFLAKIPFLRIVYNATKQFMETFLDKGHQGFEKVVLFEYPRKGIYVLGFLTGRTSGELKGKTKGDTLSIFLPTTPNPTSGFYVIVPAKDVIKMDMKVEDAFKVIMTGGIVVPDHPSGMPAGVKGLTEAEAPRSENEVAR